MSRAGSTPPPRRPCAPPAPPPPSPIPPASPPTRRRGALTVSPEVLGPADSATVGGKAANFGILRDAIPEDSPVAIAVPFDLWDAFLDQTLPPAAGGQRLRDAIAARLAGHVYPPDLLALDHDLPAVRALIETQTAFAPALRQGVEAGLVGAGFDPRARPRFRRSP